MMDDHEKSNARDFSKISNEQRQQLAAALTAKLDAEQAHREAVERVQELQREVSRVSAEAAGYMESLNVESVLMGRLQFVLVKAERGSGGNTVRTMPCSMLVLDRPSVKLEPYSAEPPETD